MRKLLSIAFVALLLYAILGPRPLTLRRLTGGRVAFAAWRMPNGEVREVKLTQSEHDDFVHRRIGSGGRPHPEARFMMAAGGIPALDTADGFPQAGDMWLRPDRRRGRVLVIATSGRQEWSYSQASASDPGDGNISLLTGIRAASFGNRIVLPSYDLKKIARSAGDLVRPTVAVASIREVIPNHHSVTFDAKSSGTHDGATSLTVSHVMGSGSNGYLAAGVNVAWTSPSSVTYAGAALTSRLSVAPGTPRMYYWDKVAPAAGTANIVWTFGDSGACAGGGISATGVDQTTPRTSEGTNSGTSTSATLTRASATGELVISFFGYSWQPVVTPDATWTNDFNVINTGADTRIIGMHTAGASSVTRTDSLDSSQEWVAAGAAIAAAAGGAAAPKLLGLTGVGQ